MRSLRYWLMLLPCLAGMAAMPARAAGTTAGTSVVNTVTVNWVKAGVPQPAETASASFQVAQLVRATVVWQDSAQVEVPAGSKGSLRFEVTNAGNGSDSFALSFSLPTPPSPSFVPDNCQIYLDQALTQPYQPGINDPTLNPGQSQLLFANCHVPAQTQPGSHARLSLTATSNTLSGANQSACPGGGCSNPTNPAANLAGVWVVTDATGGAASATGDYLSLLPAFEFTLTQSVQDGSGGGQVQIGSIITYTLTVTPTGSSIAYDTRVADPIPNHTTYLPGSLTLDGAPLTDAQDGDGGYFDALNNRVVVKLGDYPPTDPVSVITFRVTITSS